MAQSKRTPQHRPQLDGIRGFACLTVVVAHYVGKWEFASNIAVLVFFVLSSFLVTSILLDMADRKAEGSGASIANFFARRCLRLWPAYYTALAFALVLDAPGMRASVWWHSFYLTNFYMAITDQWGPESSGPWWSLAIEQQFYIVWPAVVLITPRRWLLLVILGLSMMGFFLRIQISEQSVAFWTTPFGAFSAFGSGALLALLGHRRVWNPWLLLTLPAAYFVSQQGIGLTGGAAFGVYQTAVSILAAGLIAICYLDFPGPLRWIFGNPVIVYFGKISYGLYVYHNLVASLLGQQIPSVSLPGIDRLLIDAPIAIALATASWYIIEQPVNNMKRYFPYLAPRSKK